MAIKRPYFVGFDGTGDILVPNQLDDAANARFIPNQAANVRSMLGQDGNAYVVADKSVAPRGQKVIIWSSEGYVSTGNNLTTSTAPATPNNSALNGVTIPALTATQKKTTGSTGSATTGNIGTLLGATPPTLDFSPFRQIVAFFNLISFTGGSSPSIQFEIDTFDDAASPAQVTNWKPAAALTTAATIMVVMGPQQPFMQSVTTAAVTSMGANFPAVTNTMPTGLTTYYAIPLEFLPNGQVQWTVANTPTAVAWTAFIYGKY